MKTSPLSLPMIALVTLASCSTQQTAINRTPVSLNPDSSLTETLFEDVNVYRSSQGAPDLKRDAGLDRLAREHCDYLLEHSGTFSAYGKYVSHVGSEGRSLYAIRRLNMMSTSENVASTMYDGSDRKTADNLVYLWKNSTDHNYAMCSPVWTHTGVAAVVGPDGRVYATQLFSTKNLSDKPSKTQFQVY